MTRGTAAAAAAAAGADCTGCATAPLRVFAGIYKVTAEEKGAGSSLLHWSLPSVGSVAVFSTVVGAERARCVPGLHGGSADFIKPESLETLADVWGAGTQLDAGSGFMARMSY